MEQEPGASGKSMIYNYRQHLIAFDFDGHLPSGDKIVRAEIVRSKAEPKPDIPLGLVRVVRGAWLEAFLDEAELFPDGEHDDQIDALSGAMAVLIRKLGMAPVVMIDPKSLAQVNQWAAIAPGSMRV
jgi:predicted phage terminase large subunit-like protein